MPKSPKVQLPVYGIVIKHYDNISTIEHDPDLYKKCPHCNNSGCCYDCTYFDDTTEYVENRLHFNGVIDGIMTLILAHWQAGIDVLDEAYIDGIKTAIEEAQTS